MLSSAEGDGVQLAMKFHWYWPFARSEELDWARGTARPGEEIVIEVVDRPEAPAGGSNGRVTVVRDLPDVDRAVGRAAWALSRAKTYRARAAIRGAHWRADDFDLFHVHYVNRFTDGFVSLPRPLVMSVHDVTPHVSRVGHRAEARLLARLYGRPDALVVHHVRLADSLRSQFGVDARKIHVIPHQVFPIGEQPTPRPDTRPHLLFFGALRPNKGLEVLGEAMRLLAGQDLALTVAGRGDERLERYVENLAASDPRVTAEVGFASLERKRELFRSAHVAVLPYTSFASQSGVLHDAYGHGRPAVVTDVGALGTTVREEGTGVVIPPNDPRALADAILALLEPDAWGAAAQACRHIATERSPQAVGRQLREVYEVLLG